MADDSVLPKRQLRRAGLALVRQGESIPRSSLDIPMPEGAMPPRGSTIHRQPEPPDGLEVFEQRVMASESWDVWPVNRVFLRALLRYVRRLERDVAEGGFW